MWGNGSAVLAPWKGWGSNPGRSIWALLLLVVPLLRLGVWPAENGKKTCKRPRKVAKSRVLPKDFVLL